GSSPEGLDPSKPSSGKSAGRGFGQPKAGPKGACHGWHAHMRRTRRVEKVQESTFSTNDRVPVSLAVPREVPTRGVSVCTWMKDGFRRLRRVRAGRAGPQVDQGKRHCRRGRRV